VFVPEKSSFAPILKCFEFSEYRRRQHRKLDSVWNISSTLLFYSQEQVFFAPETYGRRDLYQAEGLLDQALNLVDVNVRDSIEEKTR